MLNILFIRISLALICQLFKFCIILESGSSSESEIHAIVCGSRAHLEQDAVAHRSIFRTILMHGFHALVYTFGVRTVRDTQCGFKMFTRAAARVLFSNLHVDRW